MLNLWYIIDSAIFRITTWMQIELQHVQHVSSKRLPLKIKFTYETVQSRTYRLYLESL